MSDARRRIFERIERALERRWPPQLPNDPWRPDEPKDVLALFQQNMTAAGAEVEVFDSLAAAAAWLPDWAAQFSSVAISPLLPDELRPPLPAAAPEEAELGVSRALAGVATTGSVLLSSAEGRRLQLLPPAHLVFVDAAEVVMHLAEALEKHKDELPSALALHSGPSRSADIGQIMVQGVHGPGRLVVAVVKGLNAPARAKSPARRKKPTAKPAKKGLLDWNAVMALEGRQLATKRGEPFTVVKVTENTVRVRVASSGKEYTVRRSSLEKAAGLVASGTPVSGPAAYRKLVANEAPAYGWSLLHALDIV